MCDNLIYRTHKRHRKSSNKRQSLAYNFIVKAIRKNSCENQKEDYKMCGIFYSTFYKNIVDISIYIAYYRGSF